MCGAKADIIKAVNNLAAASEESGEKCDKAERVRGVIFVDSLACVGRWFYMESLLF
jgi:hypothetical protein